MVGGGKVEEWKTLLFCWKENWEEGICSLYKFILMVLLEKKSNKIKKKKPKQRGKKKSEWTHKNKKEKGKRKVEE